jgi:hypothetical protein
MRFSVSFLKLPALVRLARGAMVLIRGENAVSESVYFVQECPTCGRSLRIRIGYLGKHVVCQHCRGRFQACDPASPHYPPVDSGIDLLRRADELLELSSLQPPSAPPRWRLS